MEIGTFTVNIQENRVLLITCGGWSCSDMHNYIFLVNFIHVVMDVIEKLVCGETGGPAQKFN